MIVLPLASPSRASEWVPPRGMVGVAGAAGALVVYDDGRTFATPTGGLALSAYGRVAAAVHLGGRFSFDLTPLPLCEFDGETTYGVAATCDELYRPAGTALGALLAFHFVVGVELGDHVVLRPMVGAGGLASEALPFFTAIPVPSLGLDLDVALYRGEAISVLLGAGFAARPYVLPGNVLMLPQGKLGFEI